MKHPVIGFAMCGSFCTFEKALAQLALLRKDWDMLPVMSETAYTTDTRFGTAKSFGDASSFRERLEAICSHEILHTIPQVEPIGPKALLDALVIAPCTGNTIAKLANGIADTPVTLAAKAHLRNEAPIVIAVSTNDALAGNAANIGTLLNRKHYYFVPFRQDSPQKKPRSMVADFSKLTDTVCHALQGEQLQPILL